MNADNASEEKEGAGKGRHVGTGEWMGRKAPARSGIRRRTARVLGLVAAVAVVVVLLLLLALYIAPEKPGGRKDLVLAAAQILGGTALLSGLYFTWRNLHVNREGQITERFTRAIDQLGATDDDGARSMSASTCEGPPRRLRGTPGCRRTGGRAAPAAQDS
jgi:uncharacterized membrane protein